MLVKSLCRQTIQLSKIDINHDLLATNKVNPALNELNRDGKAFGCEVLLVRHAEKNSSEILEIKSKSTKDDDDHLSKKREDVALMIYAKNRNMIATSCSVKSDSIP